MVKKILLLSLGFGLITAGIAGITTSLVDHKNEAALRELERIKAETQTLVAEGQSRLEESRHEIGLLAKNIDAERQRLGEKRQLAKENHLPTETAVNEKQPAVASKSPHPKGNLKDGGGKGSKGKTILGKKDQESRKGSIADSGSRLSMASRGSKTGVQDGDVVWISRKAGLEAARLFEPVEYYKRKTHERVLAEPFDYGLDSVRVRVRIWKNERLASDTLVSFPEASLRGARLPPV